MKVFWSEKNWKYFKIARYFGPSTQKRNSWILRFWYSAGTDKADVDVKDATEGK